MKYIIARKFSFTNKTFEITCDSKKLCTAKVIPSEEHKDRYNIKLSNPINKYIGENSCIVEPDPQQARSYLIYLKNDETNEKTFCAQLAYQPCGYNNYLYAIIIDRKLYKVRSCDLKDRRLTIVDAAESTDPAIGTRPKTLFQLNDSFTRLNKKYHVTINDKKLQYVYLAITILLSLHECKPKSF